MIWLTWRQHRIEFLFMGLVLLLFASVLLVTGINIAALVQQIGFTGCASQACAQSWFAMNRYLSGLTQPPSAFYFIGLIVPFILPALVGMFVGAPALSREFEQGTHRLLWTQSIPWPCWFFRKTGLLIGVVACAFALLFGFFSWWRAALPVPLAQDTNWFFNAFPGRFDTWGVVSIAYAVFAVALGLFLGTIIRKPVPAMALTLVLFVVVRVLIVNFWRPYYLPPTVITTPANESPAIPGNNWVVKDEYVDRQGQVLSENADILQTCFSHLFQNGDHQCFAEHGIQTRWTYQLENRFWPLQGIESGIYLLFAALLVALTFWWTKYRIIGKEKSNKDRWGLPDKFAETGRYVS